MPTFTIVLPVTAVLAVEGKPSTVTVTIHGETASVVITTTPEPVAPPIPSEYWQHDEQDGIPGWNGDDPEAENDPWLQGR